MAVDDRLRQAGRAAGVQDPERVVEGHGLEVERAVGGPEEAVLPAAAVEVAEPHERPADLRVDRVDDGAAVEVPAAVAVAVDGQQHLRLDLREAVDHRARAEVRRAARPDRAERRRPRGTPRSSRGCSACRRRRGRRAPTPSVAQAGLDAGGQRAQLAPRHLGQAVAARTRGGSRPRRRRGRGARARGRRASRPRTTARPASRGCRARRRAARGSGRRSTRRSTTRSPRGRRPTSATARRRSRRARRARRAASACTRAGACARRTPRRAVQSTVGSRLICPRSYGAAVRRSGAWPPA